MSSTAQNTGVVSALLEDGGELAFRDIRRWAIGLTAAFLVVCLISTLLHEMWRGEVQAWLLARDNASFTQFYRELKFGGRPVLWYIPLFLLNLVTHDPIAMKLVHLGIATASVYVVARFSPFTRVQKAFFAFGYYPLFEFGVISWGYNIAALLLFALCAVYYKGRGNAEKRGVEPAPAKPPNSIALGILMALMANVNAYALIVAAAFCTMLIIRFGSDRAFRRSVISRPAALALAVVIALGGMGAAVVQLKPATAYMAPSQNVALKGEAARNPAVAREAHAAKSLASLWKACVPIPRPIYSFWNTNILWGKWEVVQPVGALAFLIFAFWLLRRRRMAMVWYALGTVGLLGFTYASAPGLMEQDGHFYLLFIAAIWLAGGANVAADAAIGQPPSSRSAGQMGFGAVAFTSLLALHCAVGIFATAINCIFPFSDSRLAADYLIASGHGSDRVMGHVDYCVSPLSCWLNHDLFLIDSLRDGSFIRWSNTRSAKTNDVALGLSRAWADKTRRGVIMVLTPEATPDPAVFTPPDLHAPGVELLKSFNDAIVPDERYWIYLVLPTKK